MSTLAFYAQFVTNKVGVNGLTVTWDVEQITRSDGTRTALVTGGATTITIGRRGLYGYLLAGADTKLYDYIATAITATTTVDQQEVAALWTVYEADVVKLAGTAMVAGAIPAVAAGASGGLPVLDGNLVSAANVTYQNGVAVAAADANGNVKAVLYGTQPAVTFGQVKILADVSSQGALHVVNSNADGQGVMYIGGEYGQVNSGVSGNVVGVDAAGIRTAIGLATANLDTQLAALPTDQDVRDAMKLAPTAGDPAAGSMDKHLDDLLEDTSTTIPALISAGGSGVGLYSEMITIKDPSDNPIDGVLVQVATDDLFANIVRSGYTNSLGQVTLNFDAIGTYYGRAEIGGYGVSEFEVEVTE